MVYQILYPDPPPLQGCVPKKYMGIAVSKHSFEKPVRNNVGKTGTIMSL
jgi:hypothetical protein